MIKIKLVREIKGKDLVKEFEKIYGKIEDLKKIFDEGKGNMKLEMDLEDWEYFLENPEETNHQEITIYDEFPSFTMTDLQILDLIKNKKPNSISELAVMMNKDNGNITKQVNKLKDKGLIKLKEGTVNNIKIPVFNYDKIEIAI